MADPQAVDLLTTHDSALRADAAAGQAMLFSRSIGQRDSERCSVISSAHMSLSDPETSGDEFDIAPGLQLAVTPLPMPPPPTRAPSPREAPLTPVGIADTTLSMSDSSGRSSDADDRYSDASSGGSSSGSSRRHTSRKHRYRRTRKTTRRKVLQGERSNQP